MAFEVPSASFSRIRSGITSVMCLQAKALLAERQASGKSAGPSGALHESRQSSAASTLTWAPLDAVRFASVFAAHIQELADNRFIKQEQVAFRLCTLHYCCKGHDMLFSRHDCRGALTAGLCSCLLRSRTW